MLQKETERNDDSTPTRSIKIIAEEIGEPAAKVTKWLSQMYANLFELNHEHPKLFESPGSKYNLHFKNRSTSQTSYFTIWLDQTLSLKDRFDWHFMNAQLGGYFYYVSEITHERYKGELTTTVFLNSGFYNEFREMLLYKADFINSISLDERFHLNDYQLDVLLRERVEKGKDVGFETRKGEKNYFKGSNW